MNDLTVASVETYAPLARVSLVVRAGSRYEPVDQLGVTHFTRLAAAQVRSSSSSSYPFYSPMYLSKKMVIFLISSVLVNLIRVDCTKITGPSCLKLTTLLHVVNDSVKIRT